MSTGLYSHTTRGTGTTLTAAIYNSDHQNHVTNQNPLQTGAYSDNLTQYQLQTDPGGLGSESLAPHLAGELERIRFALARLLGKTRWYQAPDATLAQLAPLITPPVLLAAAATLLNLRRTENDAVERDVQTLQSGSGAGTQRRRTITGGAANNVARSDVLYGSTRVDEEASNYRKFHVTVIFGLNANITIDPTGYQEMKEVAAPASPAADTLRLYALDDGGTTALAYRDSAGSDRIMTGRATVAEMKAAVGLSVHTSPGRQHFHPGHPKFWASVVVSGGTPSIVASYNVSGIVDNGNGDLTINFSTSFANANYAVSATVEYPSGGNSTYLANVATGGKATGSVRVQGWHTGASANATMQDPNAYFVMGWGDQ